jgi:uncharacterized metal-binding protein
MSDNDKNNLPLVVACSGGSPAGNLADLVARGLQEKGLARMVSFSGMTGNITEGSLAAMAPRVIVIDGCHSACAKQAMALRGFEDCEYVDLIEAGITKPGLAPTKAAVEKGVTYISRLLGSKKQGLNAKYNDPKRNI